jgi:hypothetical protein
MKWIHLWVTKVHVKGDQNLKKKDPMGDSNIGTIGDVEEGIGLGQSPCELESI